MSIKLDLNELAQINNEIKRLQGNIRTLRKRANELSESTINYLKEKDQPGVKYNGTAIIIETKSKRESKSNKDRENDALKILEEEGISNASKVLNDILEARKGNLTDIQKIKIKKLNNY